MSRKLIRIHRLPLILLLMALFYITPLIFSGVPETHDADVNIARIAAHYSALQDGHIPPRWAGELNYGFGMPVLSFYYPLPGYIGSVLHATGLSFGVAYKSIIIGSVLIAGIGFYLWARTHFSVSNSMITAFIYAFVPYQILNMYVRGDIGELMAYAIIPLTLTSIEKVRNDTSVSSVIVGAATYALLILSHNIISLLMTPVLIGYAMMRSKSKKMATFYSAIIAGGLALSAYYWIPALYEQQYTMGMMFIGDMFMDHFLEIGKVMYAPWGFGADVRLPEGQAPQLGPVLAAASIISVYVIVKKSASRRIAGYWIVVLLSAIAMTTAITILAWHSVPIIKMIQFPWRFLSVASVAAVVLLGFVLRHFEKKLRYFSYSILLLFIITTLPFAMPQGYFHHDDGYYYGYPFTTSFHGQTTPIWTAGDSGNYAERPVEIIGGEARVTNYIKKTHVHTYTIDAARDAQILDNTFYFPGWRVYVDGKETEIQFQDINHRGLIVFEAPAGTHDIEVRYTETKVRLLADILSAGTVLTMILLSAYAGRKRRT